MYGLCRYPETQRKLREEFLNFPGSLYPDSDMPRYDELNTLPYLDAVVRETLRLYAPVASTSRNAEEDCVIPLAEPIIDRNGVKKTEILCVAFSTRSIVPCFPTCKSSFADEYDCFAVLLKTRALLFLSRT